VSNVTHVHERADTAARTVDPILLAHALEHIAATAARSRSQTRRIRWIEQRALMALAGREFRDLDIELPKSPGPHTHERLQRRIAYLISALHRIRELGPTPGVMAIVNEALASPAAQEVAHG
jgi:hypothetical protein